MPIKDQSLDNSAGRKHPVPQNVMDVEFKVVGDLTIRQVLYIAAGGTIAYFTFFRLGLPLVWQWGLSGFFLILGLAVAFVPLQERSLDKWIVIFLKSMFAPTQMKWQKEYAPPSYFLSDYANIIKNEIITLTPVKSRSKLEQYLENIKETDDPLDYMSSQDITKLRSDIALANKGDVSISYDNTSSAPTLVVPVIDDSFASARATNLVATEPIKKVEIAPAVSTPTQELPEKIAQQKVDQKPSDNIPTFEEIKNDEIESKNELMSALAQIEGGYNQEGPIEVMNKSEYNRPIKIKEENSSGEINIKGLRKLPPIIIAEDIKDIKEQEENLEKKVSELLNLAKKAREKYKISDGKDQTPSTVDTHDTKLDVVKGRFSELQQEKEKLTSELGKSKEQIQMLKNDSKNTSSLQQQIDLLTKRNQELENMLKQIHEELYEVKKEHEAGFEVDTNFKKEVENIKADDASLHTYKSKYVSANKINIIEGIVKGKSGELVDNAVVLIKDSDGNVARALKTNQLGQFRIQSPMANGKYFVEVIKGGLSFDVFSVECKGAIIPPLYFVSK